MPKSVIAKSSWWINIFIIVVPSVPGNFLCSQVYFICFLLFV